MPFPSGENATEVTLSMWPSDGSETGFPVCGSHILIVLSDDPETMHFPSGENATEVTQSVWP